jgi:hypothetical protein
MKARPLKDYMIVLFLVGIAVVILISVLYFANYSNEGDEKDLGDIKSSYSCDLGCHIQDHTGYNNSQNNSYIRAHYENDIECLDCHFKGVDVEVETPHYEVRYNETCLSGCHDEVDWLIEISDLDTPLAGKNESGMMWHPYTENGTDLNNLKDVGSCTNCHDPRSGTSGLRSETCALCHDVSFKDLHKHGQDTCSYVSCHLEGSDHLVNITGHTMVDGHCNECHSRSHEKDPVVPYNLDLDAGQFTVNSSFCSNCHEEAAEIFIGNESAHQNEDCTNCHEDHNEITECSECHLESEISHPTGRRYDECASCHVKGGHAPLIIVFPLSESQDLSVSFCDVRECHKGEIYDVIEDELDGKLHGEDDYDEDCLQCHENHSKDVDCIECHNEDKKPEHDINSPFDECVICHADGHDVDNITFSGLDLEFRNKDFCNLCHQEGYGPAPAFYESIPKPHSVFRDECSESCHSDHLEYKSCVSIGCHVNSFTPASHEDTSENCYLCHKSAHDPVKINYVLGYNLSQKDYFDEYWTLAPFSTYSTFSWNARGNHTEDESCALCHPEPEKSEYPSSTLLILNASKTPCTTGCHVWIDESSTGRPDVLLASSNTLHRTQIYENVSRGGCAGYCHQDDPDTPVLNGFGHSVINNCLDTVCHGENFIQNGSLHLSHKQGLEDTGINCYNLCHGYYTSEHQDCNTCHDQHAETGEDTLSLEPVEGGCYGCHKSGHDPSLLADNPCSECH